MMRAIVQNGYGGPEVLAVADVPEPAPGRGEVAVAVTAAGVHAGDVWIMRGEPLLIRAAFGVKRPKQPVIGRDIAGVVTAVGEGVAELAVGDRVFAESDRGGFAETVVVAARYVRRAPANLDDVHAAVIPVSATTALQALRLGRVGPGDRVLVIGASGGVGTYAVQLASALGAEVTGVASG
ncbi:quinone oxidoreductase family protein, partial [Agromyces binzhouensis]